MLFICFYLKSVCTPVLFLPIRKMEKEESKELETLIHRLRKWAAETPQKAAFLFFCNT